MKKLILFFALLLAFVVVPAALSPALAEGGHDNGAAAKSCADCAASCEKTLAYFHKKGGKYAEAKNVDALKDCIALCRASADLKSRQSAYAAKLDAVCNDVCQKCAKVCKDLNDPALKECIDSCETCHKCCS